MSFVVIQTALSYILLYSTYREKRERACVCVCVIILPATRLARQYEQTREPCTVVASRVTIRWLFTTRFTVHRYILKCWTSVSNDSETVDCRTQRVYVKNYPHAGERFLRVCSVHPVEYAIPRINQPKVFLAGIYTQPYINSDLQRHGPNYPQGSSQSRIDGCHIRSSTWKV